MANLLETLGPSPIVISYDENFWGEMKPLTLAQWQVDPGDVIAGNVALPPGWYLHLIQDHSGFPVVVFDTTAGGSFSFVVPSGEDVALIFSDEVSPWSGWTYGPFDSIITYDTPPPPVFWTGFIGTKETQG